jgi:hypothetical protein
MKYGGASGANIVVQYCVGPIITLHGRITARKYVNRLSNQVHHVTQRLSSNNDAVSQDDHAPFTQLELFSHSSKSMKVNFNIFPGPAQSPYLITEPLWSVLKIRTRNRFPSPTSLKQHEDVLQEEWYKIPLETVQILYESIRKRTEVVLTAKGGPKY